MKYTLASILFGVLLATASATSHGAQAIPDDPELVAWMQSANAAQLARLEELAGRDDARSKVLAMHLVHPMFPLRDQPEQEIAAEQRRSWKLLDEAFAADPGDVVVAWMLTTCAPGSGSAGCGSSEAVQALAEAGPERAEVQLWLAQAAQARGDDAGAQTHLQAAAEADTFGALEYEAERTIWAAWDGIRIPEPTPAVAASFAAAFQLDADAAAEQAVAVSALARIAALPSLSLQYLREPCDPEIVYAAPGGQRRSQCLAIMALLASEATSTLHRLVSEPAMVVLSEGSAVAEQWRERLRQTLWVYENASTLLVQLPPEGNASYFAAWRQAGEWQALRVLLAENGVAAEPGPGWLPQAPRMRALIAGIEEPQLEEPGPAGSN